MEEDITHLMTRLVFQLALILAAAKIGGEISERFLKVPPVLGELAAGALIGPFVLGGVDFPGIGPIFQNAASEGSVIPVSTEMWFIAQMGAVILLFHAGLETNLKQFLRYAAPASLVALGGVLIPFFLGAYGTVLLGPAEKITDVEALFMGSILTATSIGISVRVLRDIGSMETPESVTIVAAAVIDDVLGILILAVVVAIAVSGSVSASDVTIIGVKAVGLWLGITVVGLLLANHISKFVGLFNVPGAALGLGLALAFFAAGLAEAFGLAMIIGAYSIGLALSGSDLAHRLEDPLKSVDHALVPVFFVVMGMMVDFGAVTSVLGFGVVITILAVLGKVVGAGAPAFFTGFNKLGAWRIGIGMMPRGEVALIIAGIGLTRGVIEADLFGVSIMMTMVTTILAPIILVPAFRGGASGRRNEISQS